MSQTFTLYPTQVFSCEICEIFKNTFKNTNNYVEYLRTAAPVNGYLWSFEIFCQTGDNFFMAVFIHYWCCLPFSKESMKVKKVSDFDLFNTCAWLIHVSQNKKWIDIIIIHTHFSKNPKTLKKTSNLKMSFFLRLVFFEKVQSVWN